MQIAFGSIMYWLWTQHLRRLALRPDDMRAVLSSNTKTEATIFYGARCDYIFVNTIMADSSADQAQ